MPNDETIAETKKKKVAQPQTVGIHNPLNPDPGEKKKKGSATANGSHTEFTLPNPAQL
jgi:hypothetical protein